MVSFSKTLPQLQITGQTQISFQLQTSPMDIETIFRSQYKPSGFWSENFLPYISAFKNERLKRTFEKYKPRGLFSEFYGTPLHWLPLGASWKWCLCFGIYPNQQVAINMHGIWYTLNVSIFIWTYTYWPCLIFLHAIFQITDWIICV